MRILVTGINGLLGKDIGRYLSYNERYEIYGIGRAECFCPNIHYTKLDLSNKEMLKRYLELNSIDVIIHCAAMTKIDLCEENNEDAVNTNIIASKVLAEYGCRMLYISSDAVFNGESGNYRETDHACPANFYGYTKWQGEVNVLEHNHNSVVLRTSMYGFNVNNNVSLAQWAAAQIRQKHKISGFTDVKTNPLYTAQIAEMVYELIQSDYRGILNLGCKESVSRYDFFCKLARLMSVEPMEIITPVSVDSMIFKAKRTKNTILDTRHLNEKLGLAFSIDDGLTKFYNEYLRWI